MQGARRTQMRAMVLTRARLGRVESLEFVFGEVVPAPHSICHCR
jgi:hypothetical protein